MTQINPNQAGGLNPQRTLTGPTATTPAPLGGGLSGDAYVGGAGPLVPPPPPPPAGGTGAYQAAPQQQPLPLGWAPLPPQLAALAESFRSYRDMGQAALSLAQLPPDQAAAVAVAVFNDPMMDNDRAINLIASVLAKRVREPGMLDALRVLHQRPLINSEAMFEARMKAAIAMIHFGTPADFPGTLRLLAETSRAPTALKALLIRHVATNQALLQHPATLDMLVAVMHQDDFTRIRVATAEALGKIRHAKARDAIGESPLLGSTSGGRSPEQLALLDALGQHPPPYSPRTIHNLKLLAEKGEAEPKARAKDLLKRAGVRA